MAIFHWYHYALWALKIAIEIFVLQRCSRSNLPIAFLMVLVSCADATLITLHLLGRTDEAITVNITANIIGLILMSYACCYVSRLKYDFYIVGLISLVLFIANPPLNTPALMDDVRFVLFCSIAILMVGLYKETAGRLGWALLALVGSQMVCAFLQPGMMHHMDAMRCIWMVSWMAGCSVIGWVSKT